MPTADNSKPPLVFVMVLMAIIGYALFSSCLVPFALLNTNWWLSEWLPAVWTWIAAIAVVVIYLPYLAGTYFGILFPLVVLTVVSFRGDQVGASIAIRALGILISVAGIVLVYVLWRGRRAAAKLYPSFVSNSTTDENPALGELIAPVTSESVPVATVVAPDQIPPISNNPAVPTAPLWLMPLPIMRENPTPRWKLSDAAALLSFLLDQAAPGERKLPTSRLCLRAQIETYGGTFSKVTQLLSACAVFERLISGQRKRTDDETGLDAAAECFLTSAAEVAPQLPSTWPELRLAEKLESKKVIPLKIEATIQHSPGKYGVVDACAHFQHQLILKAGPRAYKRDLGELVNEYFPEHFEQTEMPGINHAIGLRNKLVHPNSFSFGRDVYWPYHSTVVWSASLAFVCPPEMRGGVVGKFARLIGRLMEEFGMPFIVLSIVYVTIRWKDVYGITIVDCLLALAASLGIAGYLFRKWESGDISRSGKTGEGKDISNGSLAGGICSWLFQLILPATCSIVLRIASVICAAVGAFAWVMRMVDTELIKSTVPPEWPPAALLYWPFLVAGVAFGLSRLIDRGTNPEPAEMTAALERESWNGVGKSEMWQKRLPTLPELNVIPTPRWRLLEAMALMDYWLTSLVPNNNPNSEKSPSLRQKFKAMENHFKPELRRKWYNACDIRDSLHHPRSDGLLIAPQTIFEASVAATSALRSLVYGNHLTQELQAEAKVRDAFNLRCLPCRAMSPQSIRENASLKNRVIESGTLYFVVSQTTFQSGQETAPRQPPAIQAALNLRDRLLYPRGNDKIGVEEGNEAVEALLGSITAMPPFNNNDSVELIEKLLDPIE